MVPEGWEEGRVGDLLEKLESGVSVNGEDRPLQPGEFGVLRVSSVTYGTFKPSAAKAIVPKDISRAKCHPRAGQIIISRSNTDELVGASAFVEKDYPNLYLSDKLWQTVPKPHANMKWLSYVLASKHTRYLLSNLATGTSGSMKNITKDELLTLKASIPPTQEQKKIAQILSTWDQAITATERLLENSQQRKKGLMQQLLTGKKRLPGFEGEWKKVELGDALAYQQPTPFLVKSTEYSDDFPTPVLTAGKSFLLGYTDETFGIYEDGLPVIIFDDFTTASQFVDFPFKAKSSAMKILTAKPGYSIGFIFEAMRMIRFAVGGHQRHWISIFANLVIPCPSSEEQHAISEVCATADREISSLQARLDSLKSEKKALMQQLLTGKRRVQVGTEAA